MSDKTISLFDGLNRDDRGQVGIGTLIVFIALVLVAAIAAGVLINTAGLLQTQSEQTGEETQSQVANNLQVITSVGNVTADGQLDEVRVGVQPAAGADDVNLADLTIQWVSDDGFDNLVAAGDAEDIDTGWDVSEDDGAYSLEAITAEDETDAIMSDSTDRYEVVINVSSVENIEMLDEGEEVQLTITTGDGSQVVELLQVPDSLSGDEGSVTL